MNDTNALEPQKPTRELVDKHLKVFEADDWRVNADKALDGLFKAFPCNCRMEAVYLKVVALDDLYTTQLRRGRKDASALYDIAKEIHRLAIDPDLVQKLPGLVDKIAAINVGGKRCGYVFASKYCHFHAPDDLGGDLVRRLPYHIPQSNKPTIQCSALCEYIDRDRWISQSYKEYDDPNQDGQQIENLHISPPFGLPSDSVKSSIELLGAQGSRPSLGVNQSWERSIKLIRSQPAARPMPPPAANSTV
jgi:hypothetical protein